MGTKTMNVPNILWIYTDEHRPDSLGCYGTEWAKTPNLDYLAASGIRFDKHHVNAPQCTPSRVSALISKYPHQSGIMDISAIFQENGWPDGSVSFPEVLERNGYRTANFGKVHTPEHRIFQENEPFEVFAEEAHYHRLGPNYQEDHYDLIRTSKGIIISGKYPYVTGGRTPATYLTDQAIDWLRKNKDGPFLLTASYNWPHSPVLAPEPFYSLYDPEQIACDWYLDAQQEKLTAYDKQFMKTTLSVEQLQRVWASYFGVVSHVDDQIGRLIRELERLNLMTNTIIVFTSDHGCMLGEHQLFKKGVFYRESTHVPLIIHWKDHLPAGKTVNGLTEQVDLAPTLLDLVGQEIPSDYVGVPLLHNPDNIPVKEAVYGELQLHDLKQLTATTSHRVCIRTDRYMMNCSWTDVDGTRTETGRRDGFLADLLNDPQEKVNVMGSPDYREVKQQLEHKLEQWQRG